MFTRHRTTHEHDVKWVVNAFNERLARTTVTSRTDPPVRVSPVQLRDRLAAPATIGLRDRLARPRLGTA